MIEEKYGKDVVRLYEDIDEMPIKNFFILNEYSLLEAEIGSTIDSVNRKFERLDILLAEGKLAEAIQERKNLHQTFWHIQQKNSFSALQYACFIQSINGKPMKDYSMQNMNSVIMRLGWKGLTLGQIKTLTEELKKKIGEQLRLTFPEKFSTATAANYLIMLRDKVIAECNYIKTGQIEYLDKVKETVQYFISLLQPRNMDGNSSENYLIRQRKNFEEICVVLMENGIQNPDELTIMRFHTALNYYEAKNRPLDD